MAVPSYIGRVRSESSNAVKNYWYVHSRVSLLSVRFRAVRVLSGEMKSKHADSKVLLSEI